MKYIALGFSAILIGLDQFFKFLAYENLKNILTYPLINDVLHLTYVENRGAAFSLFEDNGWILIGFTSFILVIGLYLILSSRIKSNFLLFSLSSVVAGGIGNLIDRIVRGFVVDYIDFRFINFAVFNFADCCVVIGCILIVVYFLFLEKKSDLNE